MARYSVQPKDKSYRFLSFHRNIGKNISKRNKHKQKFLDYGK